MRIYIVKIKFSQNLDSLKYNTLHSWRKCEESQDLFIQETQTFSLTEKACWNNVVLAKELWSAQKMLEQLITNFECLFSRRKKACYILFKTTQCHNYHMTERIHPRPKVYNSFAPENDFNEWVEKCGSWHWRIGVERNRNQVFVPERDILFPYFKFRFRLSRYRISGRKKAGKFLILWIDFRESLSLSKKI